MFRNILVALDGSPVADQALMEAIDLADREHSRLTLFTAVVPPPAFAFMGATGDVVATILRDAEARAEAILRGARDRVPDDMPVTSVLSTKPVPAALLRQIKDGDHDLVVMGSRGRGAVRSALLGSVSHCVLHHSPVPVLIVHGDTPDAPEVSRTSAARTLAQPA
jgi:nucleotide-binding universal stress UspA family protein